MAELTERERLIGTVMFTLLNPQLEHVDFEARKNILDAILIIKGIKANDEELTDLVQALNHDNASGVQKAIGILGKHGSLLKGLRFR